MKIQHLRNATMVLETNDSVLLIDPMLGAKGSLPPFAFLKSKPKRNPTVPLPENSGDVLERVTHCLITHKHPDHIDRDAMQYLIAKNIPVICSVLDAAFFRKKGLNVTQTLEYWQKTDFLDGKIEGIPARHGYGFVAKPAGNVMGFYLELPNQPSVYLSSDTIYTENVEKVLRDYQPDISVVAAGSARFDLFKPLLMTVADVLRFIKDAPGKVIANHMEAVNHCPTTRMELAALVAKQGLEDKIHIPKDGEVMAFG